MTEVIAIDVDMISVPRDLLRRIRTDLLLAECQILEPIPAESATVARLCHKSRQELLDHLPYV